MNINLHVERLVLDGISLAPGERPLLRAAVEAELTRLLTDDGLSGMWQSSWELYTVRTGDVRITNDGNPARLGEQIAGAIYGGIGK